MCNRWHLPARVVIWPCTLIIKCIEQTSLYFSLVCSMIRRLSLSFPRVSQPINSLEAAFYLYIRSVVHEERRKTERIQRDFLLPSFPSLFFFPPSSAGRNEKNFYFQAFHQITDGTVYYRFPANKRSWFKSPSSLAPIFFFSPLVILVSWEKNVESMEGPRRSQILLRI